MADIRSYRLVPDSPGESRKNDPASRFAFDYAGNLREVPAV